MTIQSEGDYEGSLETLNQIMQIREEPKGELEQRYLTTESILTKMNIFKQLGVLSGRRVLAIGDADLSALSIAIFGQPSEVVVADIDDRLSELLFEANLEYDLPVRFVYHDMRIKIIEILRQQYSLIVMEPPLSRAGIEVFISRAISCLDPEFTDGIFVTIPSTGVLRQHFHNFLQKTNLRILNSYPNVVEYTDYDETADFIQLGLQPDSAPTVTQHFIRPFYQYEENQDTHDYTCVCKRTYTIGINQEFATIEALEMQGCPYCGYQGTFAFISEIKPV